MSRCRLNRAACALAAIGVVLLAACATVLTGDADMASRPDTVFAWPAPRGVAPSGDYELKVNGKPVFVWPARVREEMHQPPDAILTHLPGCPAESAAFAVFDFEGEAKLEIKPLRPFKTATVHPLSAGFQPAIKDGVIRLALDRPRSLTVMLDGSDERPLHLLPAAPAPDTPRAASASVIYFGPGIHDIERVELKSGQTLCLAGGALVRAKMPDGVRWNRSARTGLMYSNAGPVISVQNAENVRICGRGILDGEAIPHVGRSMIHVINAKNVVIEGIVVRNSPNWHIALINSQNVRVEGVSLISGRLNSDVINSVNSLDVTVKNCFVRSHDDSIAVKTKTPEGEAARITVEGCTIWNDWGYALGVTYETRAPIHDLVFRDCDILFVRHHALGVHVVDAGTVEKVLFENIRIEDMGLPARRFGRPPQFVRIDVSSDMWGTDKERGHIRDIVLRDIQVGGGTPAPSSIVGADEEHAVDGVTFERVCFLGRMATSLDDLNVKTNEFARGITVK
jgi:hypothetical protein